mmetsp:Transcript_23720/g.27000  ORF Transcript_23720/g.27000 Transcript_23720/m.27000 type:complete len:843 (+) Transcript_23720:113-2641(+)
MQYTQVMTPTALAIKAKKIKSLLGEPDVDLWQLREFALSDGGLVNDTIRKRAWPKLVGLSDFYEQNRSTSLIGPTSSSLPPRHPTEDSGRQKKSKYPRMFSDRTIIQDTLNVVPGSLDFIESSTSSEVPVCLDAHQIERDVSRCTWHLLTGNQRSRRRQMNNKHRKKVASSLRKKQTRLGNLINLTILRTYEDDESRLRYYQGYHDVASIFMSALGGGGPSSGETDCSKSISGIAASMGLDLPSSVLAQVSTSHFRDAMRPSFLQLQTTIRLLVMPLICHFDREVHDFLYMCEMEPFFALSWIITWFSHDIRDTALAKRLFDAFLVSHPLLPLYVAVAMVCHPNNREEILMTECDFAPVHSTLSNLPRNSSLVGWDFVSKNPADDYSIVEEDSGDDGSVFNELNTSISTEPDVAVAFEDLSFIEQKENHDPETQSIISSSTMGTMYNAKAPFQELLDLALNFMERIPPRSLFKFSKRYHYDDQLETMSSIVPSIALLRPHPKWGLISSAPADWVLKEQEGRRLNRRDRRQKRNMSHSKLRVKSEQLKSFDEHDIMRYLKQHCRDKAVIACGFGRGEEEVLVRQKLRRFALATAVVVVIIAVSVAFVFPSEIVDNPDDEASRQLHKTCIGQQSCSQEANKFDIKRRANESVGLSPAKSYSKDNEVTLLKLDTTHLSDIDIATLAGSSIRSKSRTFFSRSSVVAALGSRKSIIPELSRQANGGIKDNKQESNGAPRGNKVPEIQAVFKSIKIPKNNPTFKSTVVQQNIQASNSIVSQSETVFSREGKVQRVMIQPLPLLKKIGQTIPQVMRSITGLHLQKALRSIGNLIKVIRNKFCQGAKDRS